MSERQAAMYFLGEQVFDAMLKSSSGAGRIKTFDAACMEAFMFGNDSEKSKTYAEVLRKCKIDFNLTGILKADF